MITQIEINGFKTFKDFKVELAPFQVIVGPNGSGKSNLFDALQLLSKLAEFDLTTAFQALRGSPDEQFTMYSNGQISDKLRIAVEMLVNSKIQDDLGTKKDLRYVRLRYELEIASNTDEYGLDKLHIVHESLSSIPMRDDSWSKKYRHLTGATIEATNDNATFIGTGTSFKSIDGKDYHNAHTLLITLYRDDQMPGNPTQYHANDMRRTVLSTVMVTQDPHVFAVRQELRSLQFIHFDLAALRQPSSVKAQRVLSSQGGNLPTALARMQAEDQFALNDVSLDMASLVPDFTSVQVRKDDVRNEYTLWATYADGRTFSSRVLSDGTLQLLALATLKNDPHFHGVLCFEEPENGVHPAQLANIARLLRGLATDFGDPLQREEPLRQVLVTTHSPSFFTQPDALNVLLYMYTAMHVSPQATGIPPLRITQAAPVLVSGQITDANIDKQEASYTLAFVRDLLANDHTGEAIERINQSRAQLNGQN